MKSATQVAV